MSIRHIVTHPDDLLRKRSAEIDIKKPGERARIEALVQDMRDCIKEYDGIGIAAVQIGVMERLVVLEIPAIREKSESDDVALDDLSENNLADINNEIQNDINSNIDIKSESSSKFTDEILIDRVLINPEIIETSEETWSYLEGCLSIPDVLEHVTRPRKIKFRYQNLDGEIIEEEAENLYATAVQHEIDHLNGVLFIDHLSKLKKDRLLKKYQKLQLSKKKKAQMAI